LVAASISRSLSSAVSSPALLGTGPAARLVGVPSRQVTHRKVGNEPGVRIRREAKREEELATLEILQGGVRIRRDGDRGGIDGTGGLLSQVVVQYPAEAGRESGSPEPDGEFGSGDALVILGRVTGEIPVW
jgi:hypothetical protein